QSCLVAHTWLQGVVQGILGLLEQGQGMEGYQHILHRNLIYLATIADATPPSSQKTVD
uniref:SS18 N-terminal domain-containing protein n=1 Tax=Athene cunicularia TaxID=194338 RepID=A0A663M4E0_ATHCN